MPAFPVVVVPTSATAARVTEILSPIRSLFFRNMNAVAGEYVIVSFEGGEIFTVGPGEVFTLRAEDTSAEAVHGKIFSRSITTLGNTLNPVIIQCNYTCYTNQHFSPRTNVVVS